MTLASSSWRYAFAFAALAAGCSSSHKSDDPGDDGQQPSNDQPTTGSTGTSDPTQTPDPPVDSGTGDGSDSGNTPPSACGPVSPSGTALFTLDTGNGGLDLRSQVAVDAAGDVFYTHGAGGDFSVAKYGADGQLVYQVKYGEVVAADAAGNAYVAGALTVPMQFGATTLNPIDGMGVYVVKLAADGTVMWAIALDLCTDTVGSIAVAGDGRIAVSGAQMGTVVLDASGSVVFSKMFSGDVAFDSKGDLVIGGQFAFTLDLGGGNVMSTNGDLDGFVVELDTSGNALWSARFGDADLPIVLTPSTQVVSTPTRQIVNAVAVGPNDELLIAGQFDDDVKLFGTDYKTGVINEASVKLRLGGFLVTLDSKGAPIRTQVDTDIEGYADVAVDAKGNVIATGMDLAEAGPPNRYAMLHKLSAAGTSVFGFTNTLGAGHSVAVDACGNVFWSASMQLNGPAQPMTSQLIKIAP